MMRVELSGNLAEINEKLGLALSEGEMRVIKDYFDKRGRSPTDIELHALGQAWSEHACYKSSKIHLKKYIDIKAPQTILLWEDAGVVEFDSEHAYVVALESHNHPSAIEPYGGAATGIGGILRDVLCMGSQPVALIDPLFFGPLDYDRQLPKGTNHPRFLFEGVVAGIRDYGNRVGIPTVSGMVFFHEGYIGNCLVNVGCVGIARKDEIIRSRAGAVGDAFILVGGKTGRDGMKGVTFASQELTEESEDISRSAVQVADPITKEPLIHACLEVNRARLISGMKDLGGGGLSCVVGEMALAAGFGARIDIENVHLKETNMQPWEIWVSESQERMMLTAPKENVKRILEIFALWDVPARVIGEVVSGNVLQIFFKGELIYEMEIPFVSGGPVYERPYVKKKEGGGIFDFEEPEDYTETLCNLLNSPNIGNKESVIRVYDHEVRSSTIVKPLVGKVGLTSHGDASVVAPLKHSWRGLALTCAVNPSLCALDPFWGAASAVDEICRNIVSVGGIPHSLADCLNFGNPEKEDRMGDFVEAVRGLNHVAAALTLPFVTGNVSFYNESPMGFVPPTPTLLGVGIVEDVRKCVTADFKHEGNAIYIVGETKEELAGSEYFKSRGLGGGNVPRVNVDVLRASIAALNEATREGLIASCHDVSEGGIACCIAEMCMGGDIGAAISLTPMRHDIFLFSESNTRWVVETTHERQFEERMRTHGLHFIKAGSVGGDTISFGDTISLPLRKARNAWGEALG
jgi:phosphoribosylformylglycinamidine synthase